MTTEHELPTSALADQAAWCEAVAERVAREQGFGVLTPAHWCVIHGLRKHFIQYGALPSMRAVCDSERLDPHCVSELFHDPQVAWQIAGLPDPGEEARSYLYPDDQIQH